MPINEAGVASSFQRQKRHCMNHHMTQESPTSPIGRLGCVGGKGLNCGLRKQGRTCTGIACPLTRMQLWPHLRCASTSLLFSRRSIWRRCSASRHDIGPSRAAGKGAQKLECTTISFPYYDSSKAFRTWNSNKLHHFSSRKLSSYYDDT